MIPEESVMHHTWTTPDRCSWHLWTVSLNIEQTPENKNMVLFHYFHSISFRNIHHFIWMIDPQLAGLLHWFCSNHIWYLQHVCPSLQSLPKLWGFYKTEEEFGLILLIFKMVIWNRFTCPMCFCQPQSTDQRVSRWLQCQLERWNSYQACWCPGPLVTLEIWQ